MPFPFERMNKSKKLGVVALAASSLAATMVFAASNYHRPAGNVQVKNKTASTYTNGVPVDLGVRFVVPLADIDASATGTALTQGIFDLPWATNQVASQGVELYWVAASYHVTTTASGNVYIGCSAEADEKSNLTATATRILVDVNANKDQ